jgi:8-oxo-dGTP pyrophosphatase MutT (NUDIX family)
MVDRNLGHYVVVTVIVVNKEGKYLVARRADWEKNFPGRWTVPGGKLEVLDYVLKKKDTAHHWYNTFENLAKREIEEEVGLEIGKVGYVTSLTFVRTDEVPVLIVSLYADAVTENVNLGKGIVDFAWVSLEEAKNYDLIEGIYDELVILDKKLRHGEEVAWGEKEVMRDMTLVLPVRDGRVLLGMKKRGFGAGKINGFGGKLNDGESVVGGAVRELAEEIGIEARVESLKKVGELDFRFPHAKDKDWDQRVHVFLVEDWMGEPVESEEMGVEWHDFDKIPFDRMWDDDKYWLPEVLKGRKISGKFEFGEDNSTTNRQEIVDMV